MKISIRYIFPLLLVLNHACGDSHEKGTVKSFTEEEPDTDVCSDKLIQSISVPLTAEGDTPLVIYKFKHQPAKRNAPTVIYIPGGPGSSSIGIDYDVLPQEFGYVQTDPRGVGCNTNNANNVFPDETFSTKNLANDIVAIVRELGLDNYIIHGSSYGTLAATVVADHLAKAGLPAPKALLLEGTLGHAFTTPTAVKDDYQGVWTKVKAGLSERVRNEINNNSFPFGFSAEEMAIFVSELLKLGEFDRKPDFIKRYLEGSYYGNKETKGDNKEFAEIFLTSPNKSSSESVSSGFFRRVYCQEVGVLEQVMSSMKDGDYVSTSTDICGDLTLGVDSFDAWNYTIAAPIYYINGTYDPATVVSQMNYHYDSQNIGLKTKIIIPGEGHNPVAGRLQPCMSEIFRLMAAGKNKDVAKKASQCVPDLMTETKG